VAKCEIPPKGWMCTREAGHSGPCAAVPADLNDLNQGFRYDTGVTAIFDRLYLGCFSKAEKLDTFNPWNIDRVVNCTKESYKLQSPDLRVIQMNQEDGEAWDPFKLIHAVDWIQGCLTGGHTVLVHCHAGMSRSPSVVACYLYVCGWDINNALDFIHQRRPIVDVAPAIWISAKRAFGIAPSIGDPMFGGTIQ